MAHEAAQQILDAAGVHQTGSHYDARVLDAELQIVAVGDALALLLDRLEIALTESADHVPPIDAVDERLHLRRRNAGGIAAADEGAHAGAGNAVDGHVHLLRAP